ncbi:hypothetical protein HYH02_009319 [Chlamydomonas schloesseri]|uniref:Uncharacterized protein n=1 Tax=Chlamydomonas schloesseri TaxID=2026947 RepID=A0A835W9Z4_9CHLO|nr:hypothetical protein HYH02_009319 [Chlamydomonas schloesseri]|eukprot:KAG2443246.1 hypothetical protein HYH02_009319 [Chlamydomonas schloesseri]
MAIGLGIGLGLGLKNTTHDTSQITSDDSDLGALRVASTVMSALALNQTQLASSAMVNASRAASAEAAAAGDSPAAPSSREAYLLARTQVAHSLPALSVLRTAENGSALVEMLLLGQADMAMVTKSDLAAAGAQLGSVAAVAAAGINAAASMDPDDPTDWPNTAAVLKKIRELITPLGSRVASPPVSSSSTVSESNELALLDSHQLLLATSELMAAGLPRSGTLSDLRAVVDAAADSLAPYAREVPDLWYYGPVSGACSSSATGAEAAKCAARRDLYKTCGLEGESAMATCRAALPAVNGSSTRAALVAAQWDCATAAHTARSVCLQREEAARVCGEQVASAYATCVAAPGATAAGCGARNATLRSSCLATEQPKRVTCQANTRATETAQCAAADAASRATCRSGAAAGKLDAKDLAQCLADSDAAAVQCKMGVERAVRTCVEAHSCNATLSAALAACDASSPASCQSTAQSANTACLAAAPAAAKSYVDAQVASGALVAAVRHYHTYLPLSLLTDSQRSDVANTLSQVVSVLRV